MIYDYLIVGAGLTGATLARLLTDKGNRILVIDKNDFIGGACYDKIMYGIPVSQFGVHAFHTNYKEVWNFVNGFTDFSVYNYRVKANWWDKYYSLPINLMILSQLGIASTPQQAQEYFKNLRPGKGDNFEEVAINTIGEELYWKFFYYYTKKQWGVEPEELPAFIFNRLPIRYNLDDRYFSDQYQGMPIYGYSDLINNLLEGIEVKLKTPFDKSFAHYTKLIYCGSIDEYFDYRYGKLDYRSVEHEYIVSDEDNFGAAAIHYTSFGIKHTRIITFNHLYPNLVGDKFISVIETPNSTGTPFYPVPTAKNIELYKQYTNIKTETILAGKIGGYK